MEGRIVNPLRHNGMAYSGISVLMLWGAAIEAGFFSPYWMTFKQAKEMEASEIFFVAPAIHILTVQIIADLHK